MSSSSTQRQVSHVNFARVFTFVLLIPAMLTAAGLSVQFGLPGSTTVCPMTTDELYLVAGSEVEFIVSFFADNKEQRDSCQEIVDSISVDINAYVDRLMTNGDTIRRTLDAKELSLEREKTSQIYGMDSQKGPTWFFRASLSDDLGESYLCVSAKATHSLFGEALSKENCRECRSPTSVEDRTILQSSSVLNAYKFGNPEQVLGLTDSLIVLDWRDSLPLQYASECAKRFALWGKSAYYDSIRHTIRTKMCE